MRLLKNALLAWLAATLLFGAHFRANFDEKVRFLKHWEKADAFSLIAATLLLATLFLLIERLFQKHLLGKKISFTGFTILFVHGLLVSIIPPRSPNPVWPMLSSLVWVAIAVALLSIWHGGLAFRKAVLTLALVLSPLPFLLSFQLITLPGPSRHITGSHTPVNRSPILFLLFDEWSYARTFEDGRSRSDLPNLASLANRSIVFTDARSPGDETYSSVPRLLFQTNAAFEPVRQQLGIRQDGRFIPTSRLPSLFDLKSNYWNAAIGLYLPYEALLSGKTAFARSWPISPKGDSFPVRVAYHFLDALVYWQDGWVESLRKRWYAPDSDKPCRVVDPYLWSVQREIADETLRLLNNCPTNSFLFFHFAVPHPPFVFGSGGGFRLSHPDDFYQTDLYDSNLLELDRTLGKVVAVLEKRSLFDPALIILTSDHSWRADLLRAGGKPRHYSERVRHVPLLVKWPEQAVGQGHIITNRFELTPGLGAIISKAQDADLSQFLKTFTTPIGEH